MAYDVPGDLRVKAVLIEQLFAKFSSFFFPSETGKTGKTGNISNAWKFKKGKNVWKASHSIIWGKKENKKYVNTKNCAKNEYGFFSKIFRYERPEVPYRKT